jgi:hypothetical protein
LGLLARHTPDAEALDRVALQVIDSVFPVPGGLREVQLVSGRVDGQALIREEADQVGLDH